MPLTLPQLTASGRSRLREGLARLEMEASFYAFLRGAWPILEPATPFLDNWHIGCMAEHLQAASEGHVRKLIINVPPGSLKSVCCSVSWPAWHWIQWPHDRFLTGSHSMDLSGRDSLKSRRLIQSDWYQSRWGDQFHLTGDLNTKTRYENNKTGFRVATSVGSATGERARLKILDDPHEIEEAESDTVREATVDWVRSTWAERESDSVSSIDVVVMQRLHNRDTCGYLLELGGYTHVMLPMEYDPRRKFVSSVTAPWLTIKEDPRTEPGELLFPNRWPQTEVDLKKLRLGTYRCTPYESPVLMSDLSLRPIGEVQPGDQVVGFEKKVRNDDKQGRRRLVVATVLNVQKMAAMVMKVTLETGEVIRCTKDHRWYTGRDGKNRHLYLPITVGKTRLFRVCAASLPVLSKDDERVAGWLSGFFDGEGSVSLSRKYKGSGYATGTSIVFTQGAGRNLPLCQKLEMSLSRLGFAFNYTEGIRSDRKNQTPGWMMRHYRILNGGLRTFQRFIHLIQPTKWRQRIIDGSYRCGSLGRERRERVVSMVPDGEETVYALETTTGNYVVWGFASANSSGQLQQQPSPDEGGIFKKIWWRYWHYPGEPLPPVKVPIAGGAYLDVPCEPLPYEWDQELNSWDMAFKDTVDADFVVGQHWAKKHLKSYLLRQTRGRLDFVASKQAVKTMAEQFTLGGLVLVEDKANGPAIISALRSVVPGLLGVNPEGGKEARAHATSWPVEAGLIYLPHPTIAPWVEGYIQEHSDFPNGEFDDQVDAATQALHRLYGVTNMGIPITPEYQQRFCVSETDLAPIPGVDAFRFWFAPDTKDVTLWPTCLIGQVLPGGQIRILDAVQLENASIEALIDRKVIPILQAGYRGVWRWRDVGNFPPPTPNTASSPVSLQQVVAERFQKSSVEPGEPDFNIRVEAIKTILGQTNRLVINRRVSMGEQTLLVHEALNGGYAYESDKSGKVTQFRAQKGNRFSAIGDALGHGLARIFVRTPTPALSPAKKKERTEQQQRRAKGYAVK